MNVTPDGAAEHVHENSTHSQHPPGFNSPWFLRCVALTLGLLGAAGRLRQYFACTSFWGDEAFIIWNIRHLSAWQLVGKLNFDQAAPPLFLLLLKGISQVAGQGEYAMRSVSIACSLLGLLIFGILCRRLLPAPAALFSFGLFALSRRLGEYSAEVKQYGCDATVSALLLLIALGRPNQTPLRRLLITTFFASVAVWFSHPVSIVFGGISLVLTFYCARRGFREGLAAIACNVIFAASFLTLFFVSIRPQHTTFLYDFWQTSFPDWNHPSQYPRWLCRQFFEFLQTQYRWARELFAILIIGAAAWAIRHQQVQRWAACAAPIALALLAATMRQYPFDGGRLTLFLVPELFLLVGAGAAMLWELIEAEARPLWWILPASLFITGIAVGISRFRHPVYQSNIRPAVAYVQARRQPGDALALTGQRSGATPETPFNGRHLEALCYWPDPPGPVYTTVSSFDQIPEKRIWVLMTFAPGEPRGLDPLLRQFRAVATEKDHYVNEHGGAAYLFEKVGSR